MGVGEGGRGREGGKETHTIDFAFGPISRQLHRLRRLPCGRRAGGSTGGGGGKQRMSRGVCVCGTSTNPISLGQSGLSGACGPCTSPAQGSGLPMSHSRSPDAALGQGQAFGALLGGRVSQGEAHTNTQKVVLAPGPLDPCAIGSRNPSCREGPGALHGHTASPDQSSPLRPEGQAGLGPPGALSPSPGPGGSLGPGPGLPGLRLTYLKASCTI